MYMKWKNRSEIVAGSSTSKSDFAQFSEKNVSASTREADSDQQRVTERTNKVNLSALLEIPLRVKLQAQLTSAPWSLQEIRGQLWVCGQDGVTVYNSDLERQKIIPAGSVYKAIELKEGEVVVVGSRGLCVMSVTGDNIETISKDFFTDVAVDHSRIYAACDWDPPTLHVYDIDTYALLREMKLPCEGEYHWHSLLVIDEHIRLCCRNTNQLHILDKKGRLLGTYRSCSDDNASSEDASDDAPGVLCRPRICQSDDEKALLIADIGNDRLQVMTGDEKWGVVNVNHAMQRPRADLWWKEKLYVVTLGDQRIIMFS